MSSSKPESDDPSAAALRYRSLAEEDLKRCSYKSALKHARVARSLDPTIPHLSLFITALKILRRKSSHHYKILNLPPLSSPSLIKQSYQSLSLSLSHHIIPGAEDALEKVTHSFRFLSDKSNKRDYDSHLQHHVLDTFWTACTTCMLLHEFDRRYVGSKLVCPRCNKTFLATEVVDDNNPSEEKEEEDKVIVTRSRSKPRIPTAWGATDNITPSNSNSKSKSKSKSKKKERTLAEIQSQIKNDKKRKKKDKEIVTLESDNKRRRRDKEIVRLEEEEEEEDLSVMPVEDSDFYDFDTDRSEKSFGKGQVWAVYDDDDGMPRHYGLIEDVNSSVGPFKVRMSWLDVLDNGDEVLAIMEKSGLHVSCGRFRVGKKVTIDSVNFFSHLVRCERAAKEVYRIYPKKGEVWALYGGRTDAVMERCYDIVVFLTSYSEMYGLSMAYLEKVEGYKTVFKRREVGCHAVRWFEKGDVRLFSHQIPSRKLSGTEDVNLPGECWELDPASLPSELLRIDWRR